MSDWSSSIELTHSQRVWVRNTRESCELPVLELDPTTFPSGPSADDTTKLRLASANRGQATAPPVVRSLRGQACPQPMYTLPLLNEGPNPAESTPVTFDMGLNPATWMEDEPTETGGELQQAVMRFREAMALADYDDALPSTEQVARPEIAVEPLDGHGTDWHVFSHVLPDDTDTLSEISLTLDLDPAWLVQPEPQPAASINAQRTPVPAARLADRAPAPQRRPLLRNTVPTYLRTAVELRPSTPIAIHAVNLITFLSGLTVGIAVATTTIVLASAVSLLV